MQRTYKGIHIRKTSLKTDGETESGDPTEGSLVRERERRRKEKRNSSDLSNRYLKTDGETDSREPS